jgi:hypothetical protein
MSHATIVFTRPKPSDGIGAVNEAADVPAMRPRHGARASDRALARLLGEALADLAESHCTFWACAGPRRPRPMATCSKCWAMRQIATVMATLNARNGGPA